MNAKENSPIISSRHHGNTSDVNNKFGDNKKPTSNKLILIVVAVIIFLMGLGAIFFGLKTQEIERQHEAEKHLLEQIEAN